MSDYRITLLGGFALDRDGAPSGAKIGKKQRALLAYLLLTPGGQGRDALATALWSDRFDEQARQSLRQALSALRKSIGGELEIIEAVDERLAISSAVTCDVADFERLAAGAALADWQQAMVLFGGELLDGIGAVADVFDGWLEGERTRLRAIAADTLWKILVHGELDASARLEAAESLVVLDPFREDGQRALMQAFADIGRRSAAIRQYQACKETLARDLGCAPEPATVALYDEIRGLREDMGRPVGAVAKPGRRRLWIGLPVLALLMAVAGAFWQGRVDRDLAGGKTDLPSIVVLPFATLSGGDGAPGFASGLTEGITTALSVVQDVFVIAPISAARVEAGGLAEISDVLGVRHVLEGSIQHMGTRVRVAVRLSDGVLGNSLWAETFDRELADVFEVQDEIIQEVLIALRVELTEGEQARIAYSAARPNLQSWLIANQALVHLRKLTKADNLRALALYRQAIDLDPNYAGAREGLAWTHFLDARFGWSSSREGSLAAAAETLAVGNQTPAARARSLNKSLRSMLALMAGDYEQAVILGEQALAVQPGGADVAALLAFVYSYTGNLERSIALSERALSLSPRPSVWYWWSLARARRLAGELAEAVNILERTGDAKDPSLGTLVELAIAYEQVGDHEAAVATFVQIRRLKPDFDAAVWMLVPPYKDGEVMQRDLQALAAAGR